MLFFIIWIHFLPIAGQTLADQWEFVGVAVEEPGYHVWGSSPITGPDGKTHLFVARWPVTATFDPGWRSHSEIAHYVAEGPEGPFEFSEVALNGTGKDTWDKTAVHNPAIHQVGKQYILLYIGNNNPNQPPHPANQKIGMAVSKSLYGPWERVGKDGMLLKTPANPDYWNYKATNGVNNPAFLKHPDGGFFLYYKSEKAKMGLAVAENLFGPYVQLPFPVTSNDQGIEDGYAFMMGSTFCILTTDNHGIIEKGGGILWKSVDGIHFTEREPGYFPINKYLSEKQLENAVGHYGGMIKFERPQVLMINGTPQYLYVPSGFNLFGGSGTSSYVLRRKAP